MVDQGPPMKGLLVDWQAVLVASLIAGTVFLVLNVVVVPAIMGGSFWISVRLVASMALGEDILAPPATSSGAALVTAIVIHYTLALFATGAIAIVVHRGGLLAGAFGGAVLGLAFYFINYYSLTYFFPQFFAINDVSVAVSHVIFGALAGALYEWLEDDAYEIAQGEIGVSSDAS